MSHKKSRAAFFDGDDTAKWSGEARRQMAALPAGQSASSWPLPLAPWTSVLPAGGTAVDFGCGTAYYRMCFKGMNYIGIDQNPDMLASAKTRWPAGGTESFFQTPLNKILDNFPQLSGVGDAGLFLTVLQHNHYEVAEEIMGHATRVLKPGATLIMHEATYIERWFPAADRKRYGFPEIDPECLESMAYGAAIYTEKGWRHFLNRFGFDTVFYDGGGWFVAKKR